MYVWDLVTVGTRVVCYSGRGSPHRAVNHLGSSSGLCAGVMPSNGGETDYAKLHHMLELLTSDLEAFERLTSCKSMHAHAKTHVKQMHTLQMRFLSHCNINQYVMTCNK